MGVEPMVENQPPNGKRGPDGTKAVDRTARTLIELARFPSGLSLTELARHLEEPVPTLHRLLGTLRKYDLVRETAEGGYAIGVGAAILAASLAEGLDLRTEARPVLAELRQITGETVHLGVLSGPHIVYIEKLDSPNAVRMVSRIGGTNPALRTAIGTSILAASDEDVVAKTIESSRLTYGETVTREDLDATLAAIRARGFGQDLEANEIGICCLGAAITDMSGQPIAGISVSTPSLRFDRDRIDELGGVVRDAAREISRRLGASDADARAAAEVALRAAP
ncbi:IclR family transcriptional regulator [Microbacterium sp. RD1]|uniref:IclR family transcriptional regulator n=1 Tax=Microbacterium sp. RD1 TaxID=3457313 RepID=UPI003FA5766C